MARLGRAQPFKPLIRGRIKFVPWSLTAEQGSYALTGQSAALRFGRQVNADQGSFALTGQAAGLQFGRQLNCAQGAYAQTGQAATLSFGRQLNAAQGTYDLSGQAASLLAVRIISAAQGSYALTGQAAGLQHSYTLAAGQGTFSLTGQAAAFVHGYELTAAFGTYALTGNAAGVTAARILIAAQGNYVLSGQAATLLHLAHARPISDVAIGGWKTYLGGTTNLYQMIDEQIPDDADYIKSSNIESGQDDTTKFGLASRTDPQTPDNHTVSARLRKTPVSGSLTTNCVVSLYQGVTLIAEWTESNVGTDWVTVEHTLTAGQANSITDYSALRLHFKAAA